RFGSEPLHQLEGWRWSERLAGIGLERMEFNREVTRGEFERFLDVVVLHLGIGPGPVADPAPRFSGIHFTGIMIPGIFPAAPSPHLTEPSDFDPGMLNAEIEAMRWILEQAAAGRVPQLEVEALVTALAVALAVEHPLLVPMFRLTGFEQYPAIHAVNVALLAMRYAEHHGLGEAEVREVGTAALLHDVGMARVPPALLQEEGLKPVERALVESHVVEGARVLLEAGPEFEL